MDVSALFQGLSAVADAISIGTAPQVASEDENSSKQSRQRTAATEHATTNAESKKIDRSQDREIIAETRRQEMEDLRRERELRRTRTHKRGR